MAQSAIVNKSSSIYHGISANNLTTLDSTVENDVPSPQAKRFEQSHKRKQSKLIKIVEAKVVQKSAEFMVKKLTNKFYLPDNEPKFSGYLGIMSHPHMEFERTHGSVRGTEFPPQN